jgi:tripartite ATP-independent transporter DctP family solute receptor
MAVTNGEAADLSIRSRKGRNSMNTQKSPRFHHRLGLNQPANSPTARAMVDMATAIGRECGGEYCLEVFPESQLGPDPRMFADVQTGVIEFFVSGAGLSGIAPSSALPMLPFAFKDSAAVFRALDGELGAMIAEELSRAGLRTLGFMQNGFHHVTTSTRPIYDVNDLAGLKIRSPGGEIATDFWTTVGAEAGMVPFNGMYAALKSRQFDGQTDPLGVVRALRLYEVQTYLSLTGHWWSGFTLLVHGATWEALPADIREVIVDTAGTACRAQRTQIEAFNVAGETELARLGMIVNTADRESIRARLGGFHARWKARFDPAAWAQLESHAGGLG